MSKKEIRHLASNIVYRLLENHWVEMLIVSKRAMNGESFAKTTSFRTLVNSVEEKIVDDLQEAS